VPPGFCLTAEAYRDFIQATGLDGTIGEILADTDQEDSVDIAAKSALIRSAIVEQEMPEYIAQQLRDCYARLDRELGTKDVTRAPVAVRSSATAEDLPTASFAGQQETYLNVRGTDDLLERTKHCWASLWTDRAMTYRVRQGFDHEQVYLAVAVQGMIPSEVSGIMFTANPVTGNQGEAVINASWGLGEAIVSGLVTPDTITVRKEDKQVVSRQIAAKERVITYADEGGILELETPVEQREVPALLDEQVIELVDLGQKIEAHYRAPQDIEWALFKDRFYILQSRPITTLEPPKYTVPAGTEYSRAMFVEIFPDPLSPSFLSVIGPVFHNTLDFLFEKLGFKAPQEMNAVGLFYNHLYFNRDYIAAALAPLPPALREHMVSQLVSPFGRHEGSIKVQRSLALYGMMARLLRVLLRFPRQMPRILTSYQAQVKTVAALPLEAMDDAGILAHIDELVFIGAGRLINYDFLMIILIKVTYQALDALLGRYFGEETEAIRGKLISGVTGNAAMKANSALWDLAQKAKASPIVSELLRRYSAAEVRSHLEQVPEGRAFLSELDRFLEVYGHREIRMDILFPTWGEDPAPVLNFVRGYLDAGEDQSPHRQQARLVAEREELTEIVRERLVQDRVGRYLIWPLFRWLLGHTQIHTRERDTMHFEMTRIIPHTRRMLLQLGSRWCERNLIEQPEDVFFLTWEELNRIATLPRPMQDAVRANRDEFKTNKRRPWPVIIRSSEEIYAEVATAGEEDIEGQRRGVAGSPGVVTGVARVIQGPEEFSRLQNGEILVAPLTNPVWTPLFAIAGAIVTEVGGILSHGAIVAREYGIPAVMSVAGATQMIRDGQTVTIDGNRGIVFLEPGEVA
jgi:pyruvate,water dikinase